MLQRQSSSRNLQSDMSHFPSHLLGSRLEKVLSSPALVLHHLAGNCFPREARPAAPPLALLHPHFSTAPQPPTTAGFLFSNSSERDEGLLETRNAPSERLRSERKPYLSTVYFFLIILAHLITTDSAPSNNKLIHMEYW